MKKNFWWPAAVSLFLTLFLAGCGYHFQGRETNLGPEIRSVAIPIFTNRTPQTGIESEVTRALVEKFIATRRLAVTKQSSADALLTGVVKSFSTTSVAVSAGIQATTSYRAAVTVEILLQRQSDGKILFKEEIREEWNYAVGPDLAVAENNKREAIRQIAVLLANRVHEFILGGF